MGCAGVSIFFVLSGYLITNSIEKIPNLKSFYIKRIFRIIPCYYVILIINMCFRKMPADEMNLYWLRYFSGLHSIIPAFKSEWNSIAGLWTISMFLVYYLFAPLFCKIKSTRLMSIFTIGLSFLSIILLKVMGNVIPMYYDGNSIFIDRSILRMLPVFLMGQTVNTAKRESKEYYVVIIFSCFYFCLECIGALNMYYLFGALVALFLLYFDKLTLYVNKHICLIINGIAGYSFLIYLTHLTVLDIMKVYNVNKHVNITVYLGIALLITIIASILLHFLIEVPSKKIEKEILKIINR